MYYILFTSDGHLGHFCLLAIANNVALSAGVQISLQNPAFEVLSGPYPKEPRSGVAGSHGGSVFEEPPSGLSLRPHRFTPQPAVHEGCRFSTASPALLVLCSFIVPDGVRRCRVEVSICISLMVTAVDRVLMCLLTAKVTSEEPKTSNHTLLRSPHSPGTLESQLNIVLILKGSVDKDEWGLRLIHR